MIDDCLMTEDCRPGDCEFLPADSEAVLIVETPEALTPDASAEERRDRAVGTPRE